MKSGLALGVGAVVLALVGMVAPGSAAQPETMEGESAEHEARSMNTELLRTYALARYEADAAIAQACAHPDLARRTVQGTYWGSICPEFVRCLNHDMLGFIGTDLNTQQREDPESGKAKAVVFDTAEYSASGMIIMENMIELVHTVEFEGEWVIADSAVIPLGAMGGPLPRPASDETRAAIEQVCIDYCMGFYETDPMKVRDTCHHSLSKRTKEHAEGTDFDFLRLITWEEIGRLANAFNAQMGFDPETARCEVEIFYADEDYAAAKLTGASWFDYFHLMNLNGEWKIVNVFFESLPEEMWSARG